MYMLEILLAFVSALLAGSSITMQKYGLDKIKKISVKYLLLSRAWMFGAFLSGMSVFVYVLSLDVGDLSTVQPIVNTSVIFTILSSRMLLKEKITKFIFLSLILVIIGITLITIGV